MDTIKIGDRVRIDPAIENQYRPEASRPDYNQVYIVRDTDGDRAIVSQEVGAHSAWIVSYEALIKVSV